MASYSLLLNPNKDTYIIIDDTEKESDRLKKNSLLSPSSSSPSSSSPPYSPPAFSSTAPSIQRSLSIRNASSNFPGFPKTRASLDNTRRVEGERGEGREGRRMIESGGRRRGEEEEDDRRKDEGNEGRLNFKSFGILRVLGSGAFGKVFMVKKKENESIYAMKALKKRTLLIKNQLKYAVGEANILKNSNHPFILKMYFAFQVIL